MKKITVMFLLVALFVSPVAGFAASPWTEEATYGEKVTGKIQFGLKNVLFGWLDIFMEPIRTYNGCTKCDNTWKAVGKGLVDGVVNEVGGALHLVTFPIVADIPLPENGVQFDAPCESGSRTQK